MSVKDDEMKYKDVIDSLKSLQQVKAPPHFEADLKRRIRAEKAVEKKEDFWSKILLPARLIPSFGLAITAAVVFMVITVNSEEMEDPFMIEPRLREDVVVVVVVDYEDFKQKENEIRKDQSLTKEKVPVEEKKDEVGLMTSEEEISSGRKEEIVRRGEGNIWEESNLDSDPLVETESPSPESTFADVSGEVEHAETSTERATGLAITKEELNFRQIQLTKEQIEEVDQLRSRVQSLDKKDADADVK